MEGKRKTSSDRTIHLAVSTSRDRHTMSTPSGSATKAANGQPSMAEALLEGVSRVCSVAGQYSDAHADDATAAKRRSVSHHEIAAVVQSMVNDEGSSAELARNMPGLNAKNKPANKPTRLPKRCDSRKTVATVRGEHRTLMIDETKNTSVAVLTVPRMNRKK